MVALRLAFDKRLGSPENNPHPAGPAKMRKRAHEDVQLGGQGVGGLPPMPPPLPRKGKTPCVSEDAQLATPKKAAFLRRCAARRQAVAALPAEPAPVPRNAENAARQRRRATAAAQNPRFFRRRATRQSTLPRARCDLPRRPAQSFLSFYRAAGLARIRGGRSPSIVPAVLPRRWLATGLFLGLSLQIDECRRAASPQDKRIAQRRRPLCTSFRQPPKTPSVRLIDGQKPRVRSADANLQQPCASRGRSAIAQPPCSILRHASKRSAGSNTPSSSPARPPSPSCNGRWMPAKAKRAAPNAAPLANGRNASKRAPIDLMARKLIHRPAPIAGIRRRVRFAMTRQSSAPDRAANTRRRETVAAIIGQTPAHAANARVRWP